MATFCRIVSCIQAIIATSIGLQVLLTCTDIMKERFPSVIGYAYFGFSYFYYDLVVMFLGAYFKERSQDPLVSMMSVWKTFYKRKTLIIYHHLLLPILAFPLTVWSSYFRKDLGDFFIGCLYTVEISTPFLSLKVVLEKLGKRGTLLYVINGICLGLFFLFCRILLFPYMYWKYSIVSGVPFLLVPMRIPFKCNLGCLVLLLPQIYWFCMIVKGIFRFLSASNANGKPRSETSNGVVCVSRRNGVNNGCVTGSAGGNTKFQ